MSYPNDRRKQVVANQEAKGIPCNVVNGEGIVITTKNYVVGSLSTGHWFLFREKYCYTRKIRRLVKCQGCNQGTAEKLVTFYEVDINGEIFFVDAEYAVEYNQPIDNAVANKGVYEENLKPEIFYPENNDYVKQTEKITQMKNKTTPDYAGDSIDLQTNSEKRYETIDKSVGSNTTDEEV